MLLCILQLLSLCDWKSIIPLKVRALRVGFLYVSGYRQHAFTKSARASVTQSVTQQRPWGTKFQVKGTALICVLTIYSSSFHPAHGLFLRLIVVLKFSKSNT